MKFHTINYDYTNISSDPSDFKDSIKDIKNIIYLFCEDEKCMYVGETKNTLLDRCFTNTPKHFDQKWFQICNNICIIELDSSIDDFNRQNLESTFINNLRPQYNSKA